MTDLQWVATEALTGNLIADLPELSGISGGPLTVVSTMGRYEALAIGLPLPEAPENWLRATKPYAAALHLLWDARPVWGGYVTRRRRTASDVIELTLLTAEGYMASRYIGDETWSHVGQNDIIQDLIEKYVADGSNGGIPIRVELLAGANPDRDQTYYDKDDKTVYSAIRDWAGIINGPEWHVSWETQSSPERITPVIQVGERVGSVTSPGVGPAATFEMPGSVVAFSGIEDYGAGKGANDVMAYSSGQGDLRPQSPRQVTTDMERPTLEYRWTPSTSITEVDTLTEHAQAKQIELADGSMPVELVAVVQDAPRLGIDWDIGSDVEWKIGGLDGDGRDTVPQFPGGVQGVARAFGWSMVLSETPTISPTLGVDL